ncbi:hypothetical protein BH23ACT2_BH23ACT2_24930 [soil metagenome]
MSKSAHDKVGALLRCQAPDREDGVASRRFCWRKRCCVDRVGQDDQVLCEAKLVDTPSQQARDGDRACSPVEAASSSPDPSSRERIVRFASQRAGEQRQGMLGVHVRVGPRKAADPPGLVVVVGVKEVDRSVVAIYRPERTANATGDQPVSEWSGHPRGSEIEPQHLVAGAIGGDRRSDLLQRQPMDELEGHDIHPSRLRCFRPVATEVRGMVGEDGDDAQRCRHRLRPDSADLVGSGFTLLRCFG